MADGAPISFDALKQEVTNCPTLRQSIVMLVTGLHKEVDAAFNDPGKRAAVAAVLLSEAQAFADAVLANTTPSHDSSPAKTTDAPPVVATNTPAPNDGPPKAVNVGDGGPAVAEVTTHGAAGSSLSGSPAPVRSTSRPLAGK